MTCTRNVLLVMVIAASHTMLGMEQTNDLILRQGTGTSSTITLRSAQEGDHAKLFEFLRATSKYPDHTEHFIQEDAENHLEKRKISSDTIIPFLTSQHDYKNVVAWEGDTVGAVAFYHIGHNKVFCCEYERYCMINSLVTQNKEKYLPILDGFLEKECKKHLVSKLIFSQFIGDH